MEMGISGKGVGVGGRERTEETGKERRTRRTHLGRCKYDQRGHANIVNLYAKPSNLKRHIDWTKPKLISLIWSQMRVASTTKNS